MRRISAIYIHELPDWPGFSWSHEQLADLLATVRHHQGRLLGRMEGLGFSLRNEAVLQTFTDTEDVIKPRELKSALGLLPGNRTKDNERFFSRPNTSYSYASKSGQIIARSFRQLSAAEKACSHVGITPG